MKFIGSILYLSWEDCLDAGIKENTLKLAKHRGSSSWSFTKDPDDKRKVLIRYDRLKPNYQQAIDDHCCGGTPAPQFEKQRLEQEAAQTYQATADDRKQALRQHLTINPSHLQQLRSLTYLDPSQAHQIAKASAICDFYNNIPPRKAEVMRYGYERKSDLQKALFSLAHEEGLDVFPNNFRRFQEKFKRFAEQGPKGLVSKKYKNTNAQKLGKDQKDVLRYIYSQPNNYDLQRVTDEYNKAVQLWNQEHPQEQWESVSYSTVKRYLTRKSVQQECKLHRDGFSTWRNSFDLTIHRQRPAHPGILWVEDGVVMELYYQDRSSQWNRLTVSMVIDAFNDVILGWAAGTSETAEMKRHAWKMAITNAGILPLEVKSDHFAEKDLTPFYQAMNAHVRLSAVGNARDKVIEPMFARFTREILKDYSNWSGSNITAKRSDSHPNREHLLRIKNSFPDADEIHGQVAQAVDRWNNKQRKKYGMSLREHWNQAQPHEKCLTATPERMLDIFAVEHKWENTLTKEGLTITINGSEHTYRLLDHDFADLIGATFQVSYLPDDPQLIKAVDQYGKTWYVPEEGKAIMSWTEQTGESRKFLNERLHFKRAQFQRQADKQALTSQAVAQLGAGKYLLTDRKGLSKPAAHMLEHAHKALDQSHDHPATIYDGEADGEILE